MEAGSAAVKNEPVELISSFKNRIAMVQSLLEENEISIIKKLPIEVLWAMVDEEKLTRILNNLLSNTIKYTNQKGKIIPLKESQ